MKRDLIGEIIDRRSRLPQSRALPLLLNRLRHLEQEFERRDQLSDELMRYFPVAIIACLEGFFREIIRELIDHGPPFAERLDQFENSRLDMRALKAIHGRAITVGEFIAHQVSLSTFESLVAVMDKLFDRAFLERLKSVRTAWSVRLFGESDAPPVLGDASTVLAGVKEAFRLRHILAHELATAFTIDRSAIENAFTAVTSFLYATDELTTGLLYPDEQGPQADLTQAAARRFNEADAELDLTLEQLMAALDEADVEALKTAQASWADARENTARLHAWIIAQGGTLGHQMYYGMLSLMTRHRTDELRVLGGGFLTTA